MPTQTKLPVNDFLINYDAQVQITIEKYRKLIKKKFPKIEEMVDTSARIIGYGFATKYVSMICTLIPSKKGVKIGFYKGTELHDPKKLLKGAGKVHKHVELKADTDINDIADLLDRAYENYVERNKK